MWIIWAIAAILSKPAVPIAIITFYQHPFDLIISNSIPTFISLYLLSFFADISVYQFTLLSIYKVYIEISGHIGKELKSSSFSQCVWLPKIFNIELYLKNHDDHHSKNNWKPTKIHPNLLSKNITKI